MLWFVLGQTSLMQLELLAGFLLIMGSSELDIEISERHFQGM